MFVRYKKLDDNAGEPVRKYNGDACYDVKASESYMLRPGETKGIKTSIALEIPEGYEGQIRPRSSQSMRGILVHFGTVDSGFRGEVLVMISNLMDEEYIIKKGDRIAQIAIREIPRVIFVEADELDDSDRGQNGYGSTGV